MLDNLSHCINTAPAIRLVVQNYHYEKRTSGSGKNRKTRRVRVNTVRAEMPFEYQTWCDESDPVSSIGYLQSMRLTRFKVHKQTDMSPDVKQRYESMRQTFISTNSTDAH